MRLIQRLLAVVGTVLVWFPLLAPLVLSALALAQRRRFLFDYLMPAELFPVALAGSLLLIGAALWSRARRAIIAGGLAAAFIFLAGSQGLAIASGLASGAREPSGLDWILVLVMLGAYVLALLVIGVGGIQLTRDLFRRAR